jgi:tRNA uridine 5-carboxymethylaminomethyl modification enzyme
MVCASRIEPPAVSPAGRGVVLATGTFLDGLVHIGDRRTAGAPARSSTELARCATGFEVGRFKTGTRPLRRSTIDFSA